MNEPLVNHIVDRLISLILLSINVNNLVGSIFIFFGSLLFILVENKVNVFLPLLFAVSSFVLILFSTRYSYFNIISLISGTVTQYQIMISLILFFVFIVNISLLFLTTNATERFNNLRKKL